MAMQAALLSGLVMLAQGAGAGTPVVLSCHLPVHAAPGAAVAAPAERVFRVGPGSLQEWDAARKQFGRNLCDAFACAKTAGRSEGTVSSASVAYTVGVDAAGAGYWRAMGASGLAAKEGPCKVITAPTP